MAVCVCSMMCLPALQTQSLRGFAFVYFKDLDDATDVSDNNGGSVRDAGVMVRGGGRMCA